MKGWHKESYRHYLAGKGIKTNRYYKDIPVVEIDDFLSKKRDVKKNFRARLAERPKVVTADDDFLLKEGDFLNDTVDARDLTPDELIARVKSLPGTEKMINEAKEKANKELKEREEIGELWDRSPRVPRIIRTNAEWAREYRKNPEFRKKEKEYRKEYDARPEVVTRRKIYT